MLRIAVLKMTRNYITFDNFSFLCLRVYYIDTHDKCNLYLKPYTVIEMFASYVTSKTQAKPDKKAFLAYWL